MAGVKRGSEALFQKDWDNVTEASEPAMSDASAFPATTEASVRCKAADVAFAMPACSASLQVQMADELWGVVKTVHS